MTVISVTNLSKFYGDVKALSDVTFTVDKGDFYGLLGPNGAGKTTLLKVLTGQITSTSGEATVMGFNPDDEPIEVRNLAGIVPEQESPPSFLTPREVLEMVSEVRNIKNSEVEHWLNFFDLGPMEGRICKNLSRGQRQKVMLAAAFIAKPEILFLDEPYTGLDLHASIHLKEQLRSLQDKNRAIIMTTHDISLGLEMCDRVAILVKGKIALMESVGAIDKNNFERQYFDIVANTI